MHPVITRRLVPLVLALAVFSVACGSDSGDTTADPTTGDGATTSLSATSTAEDASSTTAPGVLTASYRGVTADTIKIGVILFDLDAILALGVDVGYGDQEAHIQLAVDDLNERGGILGRQIELVYRLISPVSQTESDTACIELTQDEQVFAVIGQLRPAENVLCYTQQSDTPFIGSLQNETDQVFTDSVVPVIHQGKTPTRTNRSIVAALESRDAVAGQVVAVHGREAERLDAIEAQLIEAGAAGVVKTVAVAPEADQLALAAELDIIIERFRTEGVTQVINLGDSVAFLAGFNRNGFSAPFWTTTSDVLTDFIFDQGATETELKNVTAVLAPTASELYLDGHAPTVECVDRWNTARPDEEAIPNASEDDLQNIGVVVAACGIVSFLELAGTAAGPELTVESFTAALDDVAQFDVAGLPIASVSSTKWDLNDAVTLFEWDDTAGELVATDNIDIS